MEIRVDDYFDDDESVLFSGSDELSDKESTKDEVSKDVMEAKTVRKSTTGAYDNGHEASRQPPLSRVNSTAPNGKGRRRKVRKRRRGGGGLLHHQQRGGSAFRRGQLMLIEGLISALEYRKQKLLGGGDIGGMDAIFDDAKRSIRQEENAAATERTVVY